MNLKNFIELWGTGNLGCIYCSNGEIIRRARTKGVFHPDISKFHVPFKSICNPVFIPNGKNIVDDIIDIKVFGSVIYPKIKIVDTGILWWKKTKEVIIKPNDMDMAVITKTFDSEFIEKANLVQTYDMGVWLWDAGFDLVHISIDRLEKEYNTVAKSIKKGVSIFDREKTKWEWNREGKMDCFI